MTDAFANDPEYELDPIVARLLTSFDARLLETSEGRRSLGAADPLLFALIYLPNSLKDALGRTSLAECHVEWAEVAKLWTVPVQKPKENRHAFLAPRATGKSTWWFLILPIWWAAYGYTKFIAAFASRDAQANNHLDNFKAALKNPENKHLRKDFPNLVNYSRSIEGQYVSRSGFVFTAQGVDSQTLGMKHGDQRPDTLLLDDIEPDESSYSGAQAEKRLRTLQDAVLPLAEMARVVISGTVTMPGSITHQMIKWAKGFRAPDLEWVGLERIQVHHALPILTNEDGTERSFWPGNPVFSMEAMLPIRHTRQFMKNYLNDPMAVDAEYWRPEDFHYETFPCTKTILSIDGAVTTGRKSDFTGMAVVSYRPPGAGSPDLGKCLVKHAVAVKLRGNELREKVLSILEMYPEIGGILVETNQGGDMWLETLHNMPVPIKTLHNSVSKTERAARALNFYQLNPHRVSHVAPLGALEEQMCAFPQVPNDDLVDATGNAILMFLRPPKPQRSGGRVRIPR
ncbi:hypothetical protein [Streptomyces sp. NPDC005385]|uniref:hypothetical protein n=1 Tax=Streptomyces sp. NPDC005385 TaxID=3157039 RepID=UPI0033ADA742